jgi:predicted ATP-grasp superfamily ATP-dependent carboligase
VNQPLAIVGASARAAAASAKRAGFQPITADLFADADLRAIATATRVSPYPEGLVDWFRAVEPSAWMYTGALENYPDLVDQLAWIAPLCGNPGDVLTRIRSPWELSKALGDTGLLFPETRVSADGLPCDGSWLIKTYRGASGSGVRELTETGRQGDTETGRDPDSGTDSPCLPVSISPCPVFQQRVAGLPCSAVFVAERGAATLLGVTRQLIGESWLRAHGFQYAGSIGPISLSEKAFATVRRIGEVIAKQFELVGLFGVDMIRDGDDVWALEVNPRYTASIEIVERATGVQAIAAHAAACVEQSTGRWDARTDAVSNPQSPTSSPRCHGKAILFANRNIVMSQEFADTALAEALRTPWPTLADVSAAGTPVEAGRPILTFFAEGETPEEVERRLHDRAAELEVSIYGRGV